MRRSWFTWLSLIGFAALVVAAVATAGLGGATPDGRGPDRPTPSPTPTRTSPPEPDASVTAALLRRVDLRPADLPAGFRLVGAADRIESADEDAVRLCGRTLAVGPPRVPVRASTFVGDGSARIRTVVAAYPTDDLERLLARLRSIPASCARLVRPGPEEQPATLVVRVLTGQAPDRFRHEVAVLRRGSVLAVVAVDAAPDRFGSGRGRGLGLPLDRVLARRLVAALP